MVYLQRTFIIYRYIPSAIDPGSLYMVVESHPVTDRDPVFDASNV